MNYNNDDRLEIVEETTYTKSKPSILRGLLKLFTLIISAPFILFLFLKDLILMVITLFVVWIVSKIGIALIVSAIISIFKINDISSVPILKNIVEFILGSDFLKTNSINFFIHLEFDVTIIVIVAVVLSSINLRYKLSNDN
jgi:heme exporter protein D